MSRILWKSTTLRQIISVKTLKRPDFSRAQHPVNTLYCIKHANVSFFALNYVQNSNGTYIRIAYQW